MQIHQHMEIFSKKKITILYVSLYTLSISHTSLKSWFSSTVKSTYEFTIFMTTTQSHYLVIQLVHMIVYTSMNHSV